MQYLILTLKGVLTMTHFLQSTFRIEDDKSSASKGLPIAKKSTFKRNYMYVELLSSSPFNSEN